MRPPWRRRCPPPADLWWLLLGREKKRRGREEEEWRREGGKEASRVWIGGRRSGACFIGGAGGVVASASEVAWGRWRGKVTATGVREGDDAGLGKVGRWRAGEKGERERRGRWIRPRLSFSLFFAIFLFSRI